MTSLIFYTTVGCHLCEQAEHMLRQLQAEHCFEWRAVDIANDTDLMALYGTRIPVLKRVGTTLELGWPFDNPMLVEFLQVETELIADKGSGIP